MKQPRSHLVLAFLACGVLYYVIELSASGRTLIDWLVLGLVVLAVLYNLVQLGRRLHHVAGPKAVWHELRTILFWVGGLLNTTLARPEHVGTWRYVVGWLLLAVAVADSVALYHKEQSLPLAPAASRDELSSRPRSPGSA